ncbi:MAG: hypothetical protein QM755_16695 [Luteolibacter sp.]
MIAATTAAASSHGFAKLTLFIMGAFTAGVAALQTEAVQQSGITPDNIVIASDSTLRLWCICGALIGAAVRICMHPPKTQGGYARAFVTSMGSGLVVAPMALRYLGWTPDADHVLFTSGAVAFLAWIGLEGVELLVRKWFKKKDGE